MTGVEYVFTLYTEHRHTIALLHMCTMDSNYR